MKKICPFSIQFLFFFFVLIGLYSCMEEEKISIADPGHRLSASIIDGASGTRTMLADNPTNRMVEVFWKSGDKIGVFGTTSGSNVLFQTDEQSITQDGKTTVFETSATPPEGELIAYYPYQQGATMGAAGSLSLSLPGTQTYVNEEKGVSQPFSEANMMAGKGKDGNIAFRNLFAILRITIAGSDGESVKQVVFTDLSGKPVSGKFSVNWNDDLPEAVFPETGSNNDQRIILDCGDGI